LKLLDALRAFLDALLPPAAEVVRVRSLGQKDFAALVKPWEDGDLYALFSYRDPDVRAVVWAVKYRGEENILGITGALLGEYTLEILSEKRSLFGWRDVLLVPIPASSVRRHERGYAQAERIAKAMHAHLPGIAFRAHALGRQGRKSQVSVPRAWRKENVAGAFFATDPGAIQGRHIILVDDVIESGSTAKDAARALMEAGAKGVITIALAH
jgi:ComF family protein